MKKILNFSGGLTSGYMLWLEIQKNKNFRNEFIVAFENTGKERDETLDFVHAVEMNWEIPIVWLEYCRYPASLIPSDIFPTERRITNHKKLQAARKATHWFNIVDYQSADRTGSPFDDFLSISSALPTAVGRGCSAQLKIRTCIRYCFSIGLHDFDSYIGIRNDESHRAIQIKATCENFLHPKFPLIDNNIIKSDVENFWLKQPFTLQLKNYEGNCDLCFLKSDWKRRAIMRAAPQRAYWWIKKEKDFTKQARVGTKITFRNNETYEDVLADALQPELDLRFLNNEDIPCSCAERGFEKESNEME